MRIVESAVRVEETDKLQSKGLKLYQMYSENELVANFILDKERDGFYLYLEHIYRREEFRGNNVLERVVNWIFENIKPDKLTALPMEEYRPYFEKLGFKVFNVIGEDIYYYKEK
jgi:hypothetical protein